ncbi:MAG TPA: vitamin K epoxide reductase family protein, partial [Streptosporangiaceae bacterium]
ARGAKTTAKGSAKNGTTKNGTGKNAAAAKNGSAGNGVASAATPAPARTTRTATPARAKSGADAARPVGPQTSGSAARKATPARAGTGGNKSVGAAATSRLGQSRRDLEPEPAETEYAWPAAWLRWTTFALALIGLGVSIYLTYAHYTESALAGCTETTGVVNCGKVTTSEQSVVFGIPVAVLGLAFYVFMVAIMSPWAWKARRREVGLVRLASLVVGIGFVLYLIYAELFDIGSICLYCTSVHVITFFLFVLTGLAAAIWGFAPRAQLRERQPAR